mmetsp:Transcript_17974/g.53165  ORF Transcript_17974/g.53165 Transcript_17974/m.53165 type:complete len:315 (-) Transcript_17974:164-1108(-)
MRRRHAAVAVASAVAMAAAAPAHHRIPRILVQTHDYPTVADAPPETRAVMRGLRDDNPSWEHLYFNATAMVQFIQTHFPGRVARAYGLLNAEYGAARADFFRLCFMHARGGVYLDVKSGPWPRRPRSLDVLLGRVNGTMVLMPRLRTPPYWYSQFALIAAPRHPAMFAAISRVVLHIEHEARLKPKHFGRTTGGKVKLVTGPHPYTLGVRDFYDAAPPALLREWPRCIVADYRDVHLKYHITPAGFEAVWGNFTNGEVGRLHPDRKGDGHYTKLTTPIVDKRLPRDGPKPEPLSPFHNARTPFGVHYTGWPSWP